MQYLSSGDGTLPAVPPVHSPTDTYSGSDTSRNKKGSRTSPPIFLTSSTLYLCLNGHPSHPSPQCTRDAPLWLQPGCLGLPDSPVSQCCRHGPCCRHHPGASAGHSRPRTARQSGQGSGAVLEALGLATKVAHQGPSILLTFLIPGTMPLSVHTTMHLTLLAWNSSRRRKRSMDLTC